MTKPTTGKAPSPDGLAAHASVGRNRPCADDRRFPCGVSGDSAVGTVLAVAVVVTVPRHAAAAPVSIEEPSSRKRMRRLDRYRPACLRDSHPGDIGGLVEQMLAQYRYALLLRPQIAANLEEPAVRPGDRGAAAEHGAGARRRGDAGPADEAPDRASGRAGSASCPAASMSASRRFFLDRYPVTNRQFYEFVAAGGYQQMALWDESMLPAVLDFVDRTGEPGPRFWKNGCFLEGAEDHPVVGHQLVRGGGLCPLGRQTVAHRRRMGQGRQSGPSPWPTTDASSAGIPGATPWTAAGRTSGARGRDRIVPVRRVRRGRQRGRRVPVDRQRLGVDQRQLPRRRPSAGELDASRRP